MEKEAKTKVIASIWGAKLVQFLAALAVLPQSIWKKRLTEAKQQARKEIEQILPPN